MEESVGILKISSGNIYIESSTGEIVLTNDRALIKTGVQTIDNKFVNDYKYSSQINVRLFTYADSAWTRVFGKYRIEFICTCEPGHPYNNACCKIHGYQTDEESDKEIEEMRNDFDSQYLNMKCAPKRETIEEASVRFIKTTVFNKPIHKLVKLSIEFGAKWQQEQDKEISYTSNENFKRT